MVQQSQRRAAPTRRLWGVDLNDDPALEAEADRMGARAAALPPGTGSHFTPSVMAAAPATTVQRAVTLGRQATSFYHVFSGPTMKRLLTMDDYHQVLQEVMEYLRTLPDKADPKAGLTPRNVAAWKSLGEHAGNNAHRIAETLRRWITARVAPLASTMGLDERAEWREFDSLEELALALAHETHPDYTRNTAAEGQLADLVNNDEWVQAQLASVIRRVETYTAQSVSTFRQYAEPVERLMFGSYNWQNVVTSIFSPFKSVDKREPTAAISAAKKAITADITFLHDLMERWSSSGAGSFAAKIHETIGVDKVLPDAPNKAFEATMLDEDRSTFTENDVSVVGTFRSTKTVSQGEHDDVLFEISIKRAIRAAEKSMENINEIGQLREAYKTAGSDRERARLTQRMEALETKIENRKARLAFEGFGQMSFNDTQTPQSTIAARKERGGELPDYGFLAGKLKEKQKERADEKLKRVKVDAIDKSSKAKGRRNVGTRLEDNPDTLLARLMSAPIAAGRSMTTARMMQLVEKVGGTDEEKTAVAYALFAYWARTYNQGLTPVHTFHETMDVAYNFGVPYKPFHYPTLHEGKLDLMQPGAYLPMSKLALAAVPGQAPDRDEVALEHRQRWDHFRRLLESLPREFEVPRGTDAPERWHAPDENLSMMYVGSETSSKSESASASTGRRFPADEFRRLPNAGGGDCLFYALEGRNLNQREILDLRHEVAGERLRLPERGNVNAWNTISALYQTPQTHASATNLMAGRHDVPNETYAAMQAVPGIYAGDDELVQYCRLRRLSVAVVSWNGELQIADGNGVRPVAYTLGAQQEALRRVLAQTDIALYKAPGHWERIRGLHEPELDHALALVPNAPEPSILHMSQEVRSAFRLLGLPLGAFDGVAHAFRQQSRAVHPDKVDEQGEEAFKRLGNARDLLERIASDGEVRKQVELLALTEGIGGK